MRSESRAPENTARWAVAKHGAGEVNLILEVTVFAIQAGRPLRFLQLVFAALS